MLMSSGSVASFKGVTSNGGQTCGMGKRKKRGFKARICQRASWPIYLILGLFSGPTNPKKTFFFISAFIRLHLFIIFIPERSLHCQLPNRSLSPPCDRLLSEETLPSLLGWKTHCPGKCSIVEFFLSDFFRVHGVMVIGGQ